MLPQSRIVPNFHEVDFSDLTLPMIVVYKRPLDYPIHFVARVFNVSPGDVQPTDMAMKALTLEELREGIPDRFFRMDRAESDDPKIVETWV